MTRIITRSLLATALVAAASLGQPGIAFAQEEAEAAEDSATIIVTGTRRTDRTVADSTVPIDVISAESLVNSGATETNRLLNNLVPSFNFPQPSLTDGTDSLRPATLRGLAPDQVLVLVNGKRRHLSSLLNLNGSVGRGSAGVDMNTIPPLAIERIEVLRDGAASQYGSDAIAGVINIQIKKREGGRAQASFGKYITTMEDVAQVASVAPTTGAADNPVITFTGQDRKRRDGDTYTFATNVGLPVGDTGYFNFTAEYKDRSPTNRSGPDLRRQFITAGDPREGKSKLGPLVSAAQRERVRGYIRKGIEEGATLVAGGPEPPEALDKGFFVRPTVFANVDNKMTIAQEEIFGPVLSIIPYEDEDDAVRIANDTIYGLVGGVWSADPARAMRVARRLRTGQVEINGGKFNPMAPFGGFKQSGNGRELGKYGLEEFLEVKAMLT